MPIFYHQMRYIPLENKYVISRLEYTKQLDTSKLCGVVQYGQHKWVARKKQDLIDFAEATKERIIKDYEEKIQKIQNRDIEVI